MTKCSNRIFYAIGEAWRRFLIYIFFVFTSKEKFPTLTVDYFSECIRQKLLYSPCYTWCFRRCRTKFFEQKSWITQIFSRHQRLPPQSLLTLSCGAQKMSNKYLSLSACLIQLRLRVGSWIWKLCFRKNYWKVIVILEKKWNLKCLFTLECTLNIFHFLVR